MSDDTEWWLNMHTFLVHRKGDAANHSILLCNLLLGFGLDAFVCLGAKAGTRGNQTAHAWVVTLSHGCQEVVFWESLTGNRYLHQFVDPDGPPLDKSKSRFMIY
jgi:centrosomal protein CEP76